MKCITVRMTLSSMGISTNETVYKRFPLVTAYDCGAVGTVPVVGADIKKPLVAINS